MIALIVGVILAVLVIGILLKLVKIAIIIALCVGIYMFAQNKLGGNKDRGRLK
jgi:hypothetical protein